jgi:Fe-S-cluster-containing dehydrogenase component/DMSO reductase anchor subunit
MSVAVAREPATSGSHRGGLLGALLREQQQLTVVEHFARDHEEHRLPDQAKYYRNLIPLSAPQPGEQYAFEVDLDACSGCKACVAACHNLNGLEEDECWRSVGLLSGGSAQLAVLQHVTSACHHCLEPACLQGCPVKAYEKDPLTGIVRHLDDQCIGCQYCVLKCPYDVPKYSHSKGIVRKCDMCHQRLAVGEAPACVQSCPNQAIRITIVNKQAVIDESEADLFLPGAAAPSYTLPTTVFRTERPLPRNLLPADYYAASPQHAHWPLVVMLVLTQMSVGAFAVEQTFRWLLPFADMAGPPQQVRLLAALGLGVLGLVGSLFHLGRPWYAYRAIIGLRTSWLSREILCFGAFAKLAFVYAAQPWLPFVADSKVVSDMLGWLVVASGVAGLWCSVMVYDSTRRPYWHWTKTGVRFLLTAAVLGLPCSLLVALLATHWSDQSLVASIMEPHGRELSGLLAVAAAVKLLFEASIFMNLLSRQLTPLKRTAWLLCGELARTTTQRFLCGLLGGVAIPGWLCLVATAESPQFITLAVVLSLVLCVVGELLERYLFFTAVIAPKMPGAPAA